MSDLELAIKSIRDDEERLKEADEYADNRQAEVFASARLRRILERTGKKFRVNWARIVIESVLNRLEIASMTTGNDEQDEIIDDTWAHNELGLEAPVFMEKALTWGECYALVWPSEEAEDEDVEDEDLDIDILMVSPLTAKMFYQTENTRKKRFWARMWEEEILVGLESAVEKRVRVNLVYADRIEKYVSKGETGAKDDDFEPFIDSYEEFLNDEGEIEVVEEWPIEHDFGEIPVFHFRTQKEHGRPEHYDAFGPQDMLNKLTATQMATNDFQGFPQRYALTGRDPKNETTFESDFDAGDFEGGADGPSALVDEDDRAKDAGGQMDSGPGEVWLLKADKVGQFTPADPDVFLKPMATYIRAMATATGTPLHHFEGQGGAPSGESLRVAEAPLVKKVKKRQAMFGSTWRDIFVFVLRLRGHEDATVTLGWQPAQSQDDIQGWALVKAKVEAGIPFRQALIEHGYTPDVADQLIKDALAEAAKVDDDAA